MNRLTFAPSKTIGTPEHFQQFLSDELQHFLETLRKGSRNSDLKFFGKVFIPQMVEALKEKICDVKGLPHFVYEFDEDKAEKTAQKNVEHSNDPTTAEAYVWTQFEQGLQDLREKYYWASTELEAFNWLKKILVEGNNTILGYCYVVQIYSNHKKPTATKTTADTATAMETDPYRTNTATCP